MMVAPTEFRLLGPFGVAVKGELIKEQLTGPAKELLLYLLTHDAPQHSRSALPANVWDDERTPSRAAFNTTLWRLKRFIKLLPGVDLHCGGDTIGLTLHPRCSVDVWSLRRAVSFLDAPLAQPVSENAIAALLGAAQMWRGPFQDGGDAHWALVVREALQMNYLRALQALMRHALECENHDCALAYGQRVLAEDPFRESVHCEVLWLLVLTGQRARAIRMHARLTDLLRKELGIGPMAETQAVFEYIRDGLEAPADPVEPPHVALPLDRLVARVERSRASMDAAVRAAGRPSA